MGEKERLDSLKSYQVALDGLRAIAIIWVLLHNSKYMIKDLLALDSVVLKGYTFFLETGWLGVQLFFVLSGFLITGILLDAKRASQDLDRNNNHSILKRFYIRRVLRIFPVYYVFLLLAFTYVFIVGDAPDWIQHAYDNKAWYLLYLSNWVQPFESIGLGHIWSLAVEEQFYIVWPFVVLCFSVSRLYLISVLVILGSLMFRIFVVSMGGEHEVSPAYVLTPARLDALVIGGMLALALRNNEHYAQVKGWWLVTLVLCLVYVVSTVLLARAYASVSAGWPILNQTIAAVIFAIVIFKSLTLRTGVGKSEGDGKEKRSQLRQLLNSNILVTIGKYSYAMYIFHWPLSRMIGSDLTTFLSPKLSLGAEFNAYICIAVNQAALLLLTFACAWLSWKVIEMPFLKLKKKWPMA